jgi:hypothetical protein
MSKITQKEIIQQQTIAIQSLSNRLMEIEVLLSATIDLIIDKKILNKDELEGMIDNKVSILKSRIENINNMNTEDKIESYPYFGKMGEA